MWKFVKGFFSRHKLIFENTFYLSLIEFFRVLLPFALYPYLISVVGKNQWGLVIFIQTIVLYFTTFINFGLDISAVRSVSINRDNKKALNKIVSSVLGVKLFLFLLSFLILLLLVLFIPFFSQNKLLYLFAFIACIGEVMFPIWYFQGIEKMKYLTIIRFVSMFFYFCSVFIFIRHTDDYVYIPLLQSLGMVFAGFVSIYTLLRIEKLHFIRPSFLEMKQCFVDAVPFFISRASVLINNSMGKIFSGLFLSSQAVLMFDIAQKVISGLLIPIQMVNQALYPHISQKQNKLFAMKGFYAVVVCAILLSVVNWFIAYPAVYLLSKGMLMETVPLLRMMGVYLVFGSVCLYTGTPLLNSFGYFRQFNLSTIYSSIVLLLIYGILYLIGWFSIFSFAFALIFSEFLIALYRLYYCQRFKLLDLRKNPIAILKS